MTSKERAALRARANTLDAIIQIGKGGVSDNLIKQVDDTLNVRDLIKIRVLLETAPQPPKELARQIAEATRSEVVQVIGGIITLYREVDETARKENKEKKPPQKPARKKPVRGLRQRNKAREAHNQRRAQQRAQSDRRDG